MEKFNNEPEVWYPYSFLLARIEQIHNDCVQVIFYWAYVTRHICCWFDSNPHLRPTLPPGAGSEHRIALSQAQQAQVFNTDTCLSSYF